MYAAELKKSLSLAREQVEAGDLQNAYDRYVCLGEKVREHGCALDRDTIFFFYATFFRFLFDLQVYEEAFRQLTFAAESGLEKSEQKRFVYEQLVVPHLEWLEGNYRKNLPLVAGLFETNELPTFQDLKLWVLPLPSGNEFFLFDPETLTILDKCFSTPQATSTGSRNANGNFDIFLADCRNWNDLFGWSYFAREIHKKCYALIDDQSLLSALAGTNFMGAPIPEMKIFPREDDVLEYFQNNSESLPWTIIGPFKRKTQIRKVLRGVHKFRLQPGHRKGNNIILSICIPSFNRGARAYETVMNCLASCHDEEIEIILSNNGSYKGSEHLYKELSQIEDSRLVYSEFAENQGFALNLCKVCDLASGKFLLLLSDEDLLDLNGLAALLSTLRKVANDCAVVRVKGTFLTNAPVEGVFEAGVLAYEANMLATNYMSGLIFNNDLLQQHKATEFIREHQQNKVCAHYPHMYLDLLLCQYGSVHGLDIFLVEEGEAETTNMTYLELGDTKQLNDAHYFSLQSRLGQHRGFFDILMSLEICRDPEVLCRLYKRLCSKTFSHIYISIQSYYQYSDLDCGELLRKTRDYCLELLEEIYARMDWLDSNIDTEIRESIDSLYKEATRLLEEDQIL